MDLPELLLICVSHSLCGGGAASWLCMSLQASGRRFVGPSTSTWRAVTGPTRSLHPPATSPGELCLGGLGGWAVGAN